MFKMLLYHLLNYYVTPLCLRCARPLLLRRPPGGLSYSTRSNLNVSKILEDIQNQKQHQKRVKKLNINTIINCDNSINTTNGSEAKIIARSSSNKNSRKKSKTGKNKNVNKKTVSPTEMLSSISSASGITISPNSSAVFDTSSVDIFKELGLSTFPLENLEDKDFNSYTETSSSQTAEYSSDFDDAFLTKRNLLSYINVCIYNDQLAEAHDFFMEFVGKCSNSLTNADIAQCCELLIKGWARKGNTDNVQELKHFINDQLGIQPTIHMYEYYLLSLAKQMRQCTEEEVRAVLDEMRSFNNSSLSPEYLLQRPTLNLEEIKIVRHLLQNRFDGLQLKLRSYIHPRLVNNLHIDELMRQPQKYYNPFEGVNLSNLDAFVDEQFKLEMDSVVKVKPVHARFNDLDPIDPKSHSFYLELIGQLEQEWRQSLTDGFTKYLRMIRSKQKRLHGIPFIHYMTVLEPEFYIDAMLDEIRKCASFSEHYSPFATQLFETLGRKIMSKYILQSNIADGTFDAFKQCYQQYVSYTMDPHRIMKYNPREYWQHLLENGHHYYFDETKYWPDDVLKEIGRDLYEIISNEAYFNSIFLQMLDLDSPSVNAKKDESFSIQPVISFMYKNHDSFKMKKEVRVHPLLIKLYEGASSHIHLESERLPMLSPPVPWISFNFGGNLLIRNFLVRTPILFPKQKFRKTPIQQMYPTFDSLNALSLCPWIINEKILDIAIDVFQNKGNPELDIPQSLSSFGPLPQASSEMTTKEKAFIYHKRKMQKKTQAEMYSLWVDCLYKLSIGNYLRGRVFWFPINTDFRSRVYPVPPNFNHLGNDLSRALLHFAKGRPLGEKGLQWLKIHLINLTGLKKRCSAKERLAYCDEILDLIFDSADNPMNGQKWWMQSDEKWQTLACCIELTNALRSGDPHNYVSHIPIHQDGSCNGLQHYAALGRDTLGAKSVNLSPSEYPQDVYSDVAALVEAEIERDCENNMEIAKAVKGFINRKIVKQTVMTYVYGVTKYGAKLQVLKRLKEDSKFPEQHKVTASLYISEKIFLSIRRMFTQTRQIQDWLTTCAQIISADYGQTVDWVTPLGFPVIQSYYKQIRRSNNSGGIGGERPRYIPNTMKQKNAFPANFIHSLDSSHMMLTSLECHRAGLTFASVHDCYWTHASQIDLMNEFCRKQFVALHSQPMLDNLSTYLRTQLETYHQQRPVPNHAELVKMVNQHIKKGDFDLNLVKDSVYFFS